MFHLAMAKRCNEMGGLRLRKLSVWGYNSQETGDRSYDGNKARRGVYV